MHRRLWQPPVHDSVQIRSAWRSLKAERKLVSTLLVPIPRVYGSRHASTRTVCALSWTYTPALGLDLSRRFTAEPRTVPTSLCGEGVVSEARNVGHRFGDRTAH